MIKTLERIDAGRYSHCRLILLVCLSLMLAACQSVPPSVIGSETREGLDDLTAGQTESAVTVNDLLTATEAVDEGLRDLADTAPKPLKPTIIRLVEKSGESVVLAKKLQGQLAEERATTAKIRESTGKDGVESARVAAERDRAILAEEKAKGQRNIAWVVLGGIAVISAVWIYLRIKVGILGRIK